MFKALAARLFPFLLRFSLTFLLLLALWPVVSPYYGRAMAATGQTIFRTLALLPPEARLEMRENKVWVIRRVTRSDGTAATAGVNVLDEGTYFNLVILLALITATPTLNWKARGAASVIGLAILGLLHLSDLYVKLRWTAVFPGLHGSGLIPEAASPLTVALFEWLYAFYSVIGFGLFPILIWIGAISLTAHLRMLSTGGCSPSRDLL